MSDFETPEQRREDDAAARKFHQGVGAYGTTDPVISLSLDELKAHVVEGQLLDLRLAHAAAERACIRPGETLAELIARLYSETLDGDDD